MCLGVPGLVVEADELTALVDLWGVCRRIRLDLVDEPVSPGDDILNHVGFAIRPRTSGRRSSSTRNRCARTRAAAPRT